MRQPWTGDFLFILLMSISSSKIVRLWLIPAGQKMRCAYFFLTNLGSLVYLACVQEEGSLFYVYIPWSWEAEKIGTGV